MKTIILQLKILFYFSTNVNKLSIEYQSGILQGDPIGPTLFAPSVDEAARGVQSEFNACFLYDDTLRDSPERVHDNLVSGFTGEAQSNWIGGQWKPM